MPLADAFLVRETFDAEDVGLGTTILSRMVDIIDEAQANGVRGGFSVSAAASAEIHELFNALTDLVNRGPDPYDQGDVRRAGGVGPAVAREAVRLQADARLRAVLGPGGSSRCHCAGRARAGPRRAGRGGRPWSAARAGSTGGRGRPGSPPLSERRSGHVPGGGRRRT